MSRALLVIARSVALGALGVVLVVPAARAGDAPVTGDGPLAGEAPRTIAPDERKPSAPGAREQALRELGDQTDPTSRRRATRSLADVGTMEDVPRLLEVLRDPDRSVRTLAERAMWQIWSRSGDAAVDHLLQIGIEQMNERNAAAVETFTQVIERRPDFAEGWNKRATIYYLMGEYQKSLADCDEVMKRNPYHFGALSGYGMIYLQLDQPGRALEFFDRALGVNPNLESIREAAEALRRLLIQQRKNLL